VDWIGLISVLYGVIACLFFVRLISGLRRSRRLVKSAAPLRDAWTQGSDVRVSRELAIPATIGSTILLPSDCSNWDADTREAVLAHESAHVRRGDFYAHLLASVHSAVFWFSPLAWWLRSRLLSLAEAAADDEAIGKVKDRPFYAGLLVDFASRGAKAGFVGVEMARGGTVTHRIERLLGENTLPQRSSFMRRLALTSVFIPVLALSAAAWTVRAEQKTFMKPFGKPLAVSLPSQVPAPTTSIPSPVAPEAEPREQEIHWLTEPRLQNENSVLSTWIEMEVPDVATQQERDAFPRLRTDEERTQFIALFWLRRDPTPGTAQNEFRDEYYRRIALANQKFTSGIPGWKTDRGRILIMHGEPDEIETHAKGTDARSVNFGVEAWRYRFIEGIGRNVILEFVDAAGDGTYRLESSGGTISPIPANQVETPQK